MQKFLSSTAIVDELNRENSSAKEKILLAGWREHTLCREKFSAMKKMRDEAKIFTRVISIQDKYPDYCVRKNIFGVKVSNEGNSVEEACNTNDLETGSKSIVGSDSDTVRPHDEIHGLQDLISVKAMRSNKDSFVIGFDTEFVYVNSGKERLILSYQFAFYDPNDVSKIHEVIFFPASNRRFDFLRLISWILTEYNLCEAYDVCSARRWRATTKSGKRELRKSFNSPQEAYEASISEQEKILLRQQFCEGRKPFRSQNKGLDGGYILDFSDFTKKDITLVCHFGKADLSTFRDPNVKIEADMLAKCRDIQGGLVTLHSLNEFPRVIRECNKFYPVRLNIRDTKCFAPAGQKDLKSLGKSISVDKIELPFNAIEHMDRYFSTDPVSYMEYAINDSVICLMYSSELWGINKAMPVTATSASVKAAVSIIKGHFNVTSPEEVELNYRGIQRVRCGQEMITNSQGRKRLVNKKKFEAVSDSAFLLMSTAANAYAGGLNGCLGARYVDKKTHDYDLQNAYPTAMACLIDPDWDDDYLIEKTIENRLLTFDDFRSPFDLMFGDISFEFSREIPFPCIPVKVNGSLIFPRTSAGLRKCYASGPELYLAVCLGAEVRARRVYVAKPKIMSDGTPSRCLYKVAEQLVQDRQSAKEKWGSKSFEQSFLKVSINSIYGKTAQNINPKTSWNAAHAMMEDIGCSSLTSPVHACLTTAIVRAVLNATMNQLSNLGFKSYSVTTDGFISDVPFDVLNSLDLYGFGKYFRDARIRLTGSSDMWEEKHTNSSFLNITTRGNISQDLEGVCAHNGFRPVYIENGDEIIIASNGALDRYITMASVAQRTGRICSQEKHFTGFKNLSYYGSLIDKREDFVLEERERNLRMDFDMKRKPLESSFQQVFFNVKGVSEEGCLVKGKPKTITVPDVQNCEWVNFDSVPYESVAEYEAYRRVYGGMDCLRTRKDWDKFWLKIHALLSGDTSRKHVKNVEWTILMSVIIGYRLGYWDIPALSDENKTVEEKVAWINNFNDSEKKFTVSSWKNCRRKERISQMVCEADCKKLLNRMLSDVA